MNAFGQDPIAVRIEPPAFWKDGEADGLTLKLPPYTACACCYEAMYNDDVSVSVVNEDRIIYISRNMFKLYEQGLSEPDGITIRSSF